MLTPRHRRDPGADDATKGGGYSLSSREFGSHYPQSKPDTPRRSPRCGYREDASTVREGTLSSEAIGGHAGIPRTTVTRPVTEVPFYPEEYASLRARRSREIPKSWLSGPRSSDVHSDPRGQSMPLQTEPTELHYEAQFNRKFGGRYTNLTDENTRAAFAWQQEVVAQARRTAEEAETPSWKTGLGKDNLADKAEPNRDIRHNPAHGN